MFNMHLLFPDIFPADDPTGGKNWNYDEAVRLTGSKWFPQILPLDKNGQTYIQYDTARYPNYRTLMQLSAITGWKITIEYEEPGMWFEGVFIIDA